MLRSGRSGPRNKNIQRREQVLGRLKALVDSDGFRSTILGLIVLNACAMGVEATPALGEQYAELLAWIFAVSQVIFVLEILARIAAFYPQLGRFFADSWNRFDFIVVALSLLPALGPFALVARVFRVLRVLRVVSVFESVRGKFLRDQRGAGGALGPALLLAVLVWYTFALIGFHLFGQQLPAAFGTLARSSVSLLGFFTLDGWRALAALPSERSVLTAYAAIFILAVLSLLLNLARGLFAKSAAGGEGS